ncbi:MULTISPECIES: hypothetical protein [Nocardia]|uniref:NadR/Ttd14 AAA domain-containing protein n=1 Tax=Nocardia cyriacigeorgica TaxID=135487 RepID=A0A5R8P973_9NOCA|nr:MULTISPECIES: hypothetical protein [Nocardia]MBF6427838.1 hypothetical protein [Nocardia cyriacigeorgica]TLG01706.1 hypothetical protein FEK35_23685 [Nocardia cyriacigeorgica]
MVNIVIAGYTAAGKTTHARLLAESMGYETVWAAGLLLESLGFDVTEESQLWFHRSEEVERRRSAVAVDLDGYLVARAASEDNLIFDARYLPWAYSSRDILRIWLESDLGSRARKCSISLGATAPRVSECATSIYRKDLSDVTRVSDTFGVAYGPDYSLFDIVVDNSCLVLGSRGPDIALGVRRAHAYLAAAIDASLTGRCGCLEDLERANPEEFNRVVRQVRFYGGSAAAGRSR